MNIADLGLIISFFGFVLGLLGLLVAAVMRRWMVVKRLAFSLAIYVCLYFLVLVGVSLLSPQRVLSMHEMRCFDDWCAAVEQVEQRNELGALKAQGRFYLVTLQVSSRAQRISQRALDAADYVLDERGMRYDPSVEGQRALESAGVAGLPLTSWLEAGASFMHTAVFDLPPGTRQPGLVISHGAFPGLIIIGDDQSFLHKPAVVRLSLP